MSIKLKERSYYEELKSRIGKKHCTVWRSISGRPYVGNCSYLYSVLKPESYQDFFDKYISAYQIFYMIQPPFGDNTCPVI